MIWEHSKPVFQDCNTFTCKITSLRKCWESTLSFRFRSIDLSKNEHFDAVFYYFLVKTIKTIISLCVATVTCIFLCKRWDYGNNLCVGRSVKRSFEINYSINEIRNNSFTNSPQASPEWASWARRWANVATDVTCSLLQQLTCLRICI